MSRTKSKIALLVFSAFIFFSIIANYLKPKIISEAKTKDPVNEQLIGVRAQKYDDSGRLVHSLQMQSWVQSATDPTLTIMDTPRLKFYAQDGSIWEVSAKSGQGTLSKVGGHLAQISLEDNVQIKSIPVKQNQGWILSTEHMLMFPDEKVAISHDPVVVEGNFFQMQATGMKVLLNEQQVEFLQNVEGQFVHEKDV